MCQVNPTFLLSPYFRFDPGPYIGQIELTDSSQLSSMERLLWDHVRRHPEIKDRLVRCANTLQAASPEVIWVTEEVTEEPQQDDVSEPVRI
jgi:hypothetical protein